MNEIPKSELLAMTTAIVVGALSGTNDFPPEFYVGELIASTYRALEACGEPVIPEPAAMPEPAVPISKSIKPDYLVCLEDGKKLKMLKRYLRTHYDMSPEEYRARWNLPDDYPMVAPGYSARRRELALEIGLGHTENPKRGRKPKAA